MGFHFPAAGNTKPGGNKHLQAVYMNHGLVTAHPLESVRGTDYQFPHRATAKGRQHNSGPSHKALVLDGPTSGGH